MNDIKNMNNTINNYLIKTQKWFNDIKTDKSFYPKNNIKYTNNEREIFIKKFNSYITVSNNNIIDKIIDKIKLFDMDILYKNEKQILNLLEFDTNLKKALIFISKYSKYYKDIINKFKSILQPILNEINLFKKNSDIDRLLFPIFFCLTVIYSNNKNIKKSIKVFLNCDIIFIQFCIVSYLILDDIMDDNTIDTNYKNKFMKWFLNIANNPSNPVIIPSDIVSDTTPDTNLFKDKYIIFKKYFEIFSDKYKPSDHSFIYKYSVLMINILHESNDGQKDINITENKIFECSFKKAFDSCYFLMYFLNYQFKYEMNEDICKFMILLQLTDDYLDINKDNIECIYTYFNSNNINISLEDRIKKINYAWYNYATLLYSPIIYKKSIDKNNCIKVLTKYNLYLLSFLQYTKFNIDTLNEILEYHIFPKDIILRSLDLFNTKYNEIIYDKIITYISS